LRTLGLLEIPIQDLENYAVVVWYA
jgi:hypothetical protein